MLLTPTGEDLNYMMLTPMMAVFLDTDPLQRVNAGVVLSGLQVFGEEAIGDRSELLITGVPLPLIPGVSHLRDAQPLRL